MFKINNLTYKYDKNRKALDNITMDFDRGRYYWNYWIEWFRKFILFNKLMGMKSYTRRNTL